MVSSDYQLVIVLIDLKLDMISVTDRHSLQIVETLLSLQEIPYAIVHLNFPAYLTTMSL